MDTFAALGIAMTARLDGTDRPLFPITGHPDTLYGYYKFLPQNNDTMNIRIHIFKNSIEVTSGMLISAAAVPQWTFFAIPLPSYADADSARIVLSSFNSDKGMAIYGNSVLYVDNLSLTPPTTGALLSRSAKPEPFSLAVTGGALRYSLQKQTCVSVKVYNIEGRLMFQSLANQSQSAGPHTLALPVKLLAAGAYVLDFTAGNVVLQKKFPIFH